MKKSYLLVVIISIIVVISGCTGETTSGSLRLYPIKVDIRFREFYDWLGGEEVIGPVISAKFSHGGNEYQYTAAALLVYVPNASENLKYQLAPLGLELGIAEPPMNPDSPGGHEVYPDFLELYEQMGGKRYAGLPITEARYNSEKKRIEQFFENVGFYHLDSGQEGVSLLHYGAWKCAKYCGYDSPSNAQIILRASVGSDFEFAMQRLAPRFTGYPLTESYIASDGSLEQIFENIVVVANPNKPGNISLKPIVELIGIPVNESGDFPVPDAFMEYLNRNSGLEFSGSPVSDFTALSPEVYRQCFTNLCLEYYPKSPESLRVRPAPLGYTYERLYFLGNVAISGSQYRDLTIKVWETYPLLVRYQQQEIGVKVDSGATPLSNYWPILTLYVAKGGEIKYPFPPTNQDGISYLELNPIDADNGTRIEYQVCVDDLRNGSYCVRDDFLIWGD